MLCFSHITKAALCGGIFLKLISFAELSLLWFNYVYTSSVFFAIHFSPHEMHKLIKNVMLELIPFKCLKWPLRNTAPISLTGPSGCCLYWTGGKCKVEYYTSELCEEVLLCVDAGCRVHCKHERCVSTRLKWWHHTYEMLLCATRNK